MKNIWVLTIKTSLPKTCDSYDELKTTVLAFDSYEKARSAFREKLRTFAFSENTMFDRKGQIKQLNYYISIGALSASEIFPETEELSETEDNEKYLSKECLMQVQDSLAEAFSGNDAKIGLPSGYYTDACHLSMRVKSGSIRLYGDYEGPFNGIQPVLSTNIFSMVKEKDYYLYINDSFGQDDNSSDLYMDLTQVSVD